MYPALNCMISDLTRDDEQKRGDCFSALEMAKNMASLLALLCGYPVLRLHLTNYFPFWSSLAVMAVLATTYFWNIPETFSTSKDETKSIWKSLVEGFQFCFKDRFLGQYLIIWGIVTLAVNGAWGLSTMYLQSFIGMEQADASMCRAFWFSALLCGAALSGPLMRQGVHVVHGTALLVMSISWALCALGPVFPSHTAVLFWVFGVATFGVAFGVLSPCFASLICSRAPKELQGQVFGLAIVVGTLLGMPLGPLWSQVFFDPSATDLRATLPWLVSSALLGLMAVWFSIISALRSVLKSPRQLRRQRIHTVHCYIAQTTVSAVAASAAILSSEVEDGSTDSSMNMTFNRLFSALQDAMSSFAEAIGRPPRMPLLEHNSSTSLLWIVDFCLLSTLLALIFMAWAFLGRTNQEEPEGTEDESFLERLWMRVRVLIVMLLSVFGGGFLNVKHSIRSALFLGL
eukprot:symbB.v1.2.004005.t1/scaffold225.1/size261367/6